MELMPVRYTCSVQISENNLNIFLQPCLVGRCMSLWRSWFHSLGYNLPLPGMGMDRE